MKLKKIFACASTLVIGLSTIATTATAGIESVSAQETLIVAGGPNEFLEKHIEEFEKENNVKVELLDREMFEVLDGFQLDGPAGTGPDVFLAPFDRIGGFGSTGMISPVKLNEAAKYDESDKQQVTFNGEIYGAPATIETLIMFYNKDLLKEAPKSFAELEELAKDEKYAFEGEKGKNTAFLTNWVDFYMTYGLLAGYGGYVFGDEGTNVDDLGLNSDGAVKGIEYAKTWYDKVWPQGMKDTSSATDFVNQTFMDGKAAAIITGPWMVADFKEAGINYGASKIPTLPIGEEYKPFGGGKGWCISAFTEKQELSQKFLDWVTSEEIQYAWFEEREEIPANQVARKKVAESDNEVAKAVIDVYQNAVPMPNIPQMAEVWKGAESMMFDAVSGNMSAKESADAAVQLIKDSIQQVGY